MKWINNAQKVTDPGPITQWVDKISTNQATGKRKTFSGFSELFNTSGLLICCSMGVAMLFCGLWMIKGAQFFGHLYIGGFFISIAILIMVIAIYVHLKSK
ncbi:hypothetical protein LX64_05194 [Chitinophaga skermanii]|uniref:Uncharacterized protein n=1 Tax=Chitinophaga skermanii TaxID=331697 RepID=A0A327Q175_9BACT|nr:hypothetical protein [Chitinophaga skermanii]RAI96972.1 hypothetical protein LX64_05194 [Chitinophaga skermanii]